MKVRIEFCPEVPGDRTLADSAKEILEVLKLLSGFSATPFDIELVATAE